jgi:hypothetical protein
MDDTSLPAASYILRLIKVFSATRYFILVDGLNGLG